jgi:Gpi18-like mannosyltransferase
MSARLGVHPEGPGPGTTQWALAFACALILGAKFWLISRLNINWDEFRFLSQVHAAARGELTQGLQNSYTHLFIWLAGLAGDEIAQIRVARVLMVILLGASALLIQRLSTRWFSSTAAWAAALAFLAMWPTLKHGGSFRADSLLLPLQLGALVALTHPQLADRSRGLGAGVLLGLAVTVSVKTILLAPVVALLGMEGRREWRRGLRRLAWLLVAAVGTAALLLMAHMLSLSGQNAIATTGATAQGAWDKTLRDAPWFPQLSTLREMLREDLAFWLVAAAGLVWALWRRQWSIGACALALLPIVFYRNSFAYYYVVMWGPACVTIAAAVAGVHELTARVARPQLASAAALAIAALLGAHGLRQLPFLSHPRQEAQRELVAAVHAIFPTPVPYIDHSGMIASFRKVNFFMSTWGVEVYTARGLPFMPGAMARYRPPLLIGNRAELVPGTGDYNRLLEQDRKIIESSYQPYWGAIRIAGAAATVGSADPVLLALPFAGRYRLDSPQPVRVDGTLLNPGAVVTVNEDRMALAVAAPATLAINDPWTVRLLWADAQPPPTNVPKSLNYYDGL